MKKNTAKVVFCFSFTVFGSFALAGESNKGSGGNLELRKFVISNNGGSSKSSKYQVKGTLGQVVAATSSSNRYEVSSGFWQQNRDLIFINKFE